MPAAEDPAIYALVDHNGVFHRTDTMKQLADIPLEMSFAHIPDDEPSSIQRTLIRWALSRLGLEAA